MPINQSLMDSLKKEYGNKKGEDIYYAMEAKRKAMKAKIDSKRKK